MRKNLSQGKKCYTFTENAYKNVSKSIDKHFE